MSQSRFAELQARVHSCENCPRLRNYGRSVAQVKRRAFLHETYWGKPVSGFGVVDARLMIVGLAPAAHGGLRTGRMFTGDRSGEWLYRALFKAGFANQPESVDRNDGLALIQTYITAVVKCAPPDNKPSPEEIQRCLPYLSEELDLQQNARVWIALGQIAFQGLWRTFQDQGKILDLPRSRPKFQHGAEISLGRAGWLLLSYHPSQQNTFTKRLTEPMFDSVFSRARELLGL